MMEKWSDGNSKHPILQYSSESYKGGLKHEKNNISL
jgi:hypothetical protein